MELVTRHRSSKHKSVVWGINHQTLVWTGRSEGEVRCVIPCDMRIYEAGGATKNEPFREMLAVASELGFEPEGVLFDSWYGSVKNIKAVRSLGSTFLTRLLSNRRVSPDRTGHACVS